MSVATLDGTGGRDSRRAMLRKEGYATAAIVGCLPLLVFLILAVINRPYISELFSGYGPILLAGSVVLLAVGVSLMVAMSRVPTDEAAARRAPVLGPMMTVPMILCVLPAMFLIVIGPSVLMIYNGHTPPSRYEHTGSVPSDAAGCITYGSEHVRDGRDMTGESYARIVDSCRAAFPG